jgi:diaminopropionate ammonia-lyase
MRALVNRFLDPAAVAAPAQDALVFHRTLPGYAPTPLDELPGLAEELGLAAVAVKDETRRLGLAAFKILGASWAVERALRERPGTHTLVAASAGNHGRAVARAAALRGLRCRVHLPQRALPARREAVAAEGAEVVVVAGSYEDAVGQAAAEAAEPGVAVIADVGAAGPPEWVIDGYATLFHEAVAQAEHDLVVVPVGVGSLAAAAARHGAAVGARVVGVEPETAACLTASLAAGAPAAVETPGTTMACLDCAEVSPAAWPDLRAGISGTVTVRDDEAATARAEFARHGLAVGESGAASLAGLRALFTDDRCAQLRRHVGASGQRRVVLVATEGPTGDRPAEVG